VLDESVQNLLCATSKRPREDDYVVVDLGQPTVRTGRKCSRETVARFGSEKTVSYPTPTPDQTLNALGQDQIVKNVIAILTHLLTCRQESNAGYCLVQSSLRYDYVRRST